MIDTIAKVALLVFVLAAISLVVWGATHRGEINGKCEEKGGVLVRSAGNSGLPVCLDVKKIPLD